MTQGLVFEGATAVAVCIAFTVLYVMCEYGYFDKFRIASFAANVDAESASAAKDSEAGRMHLRPAGLASNKLVPVHEGRPREIVSHLDVLSLINYIPPNLVLDSRARGTPPGPEGELGLGDTHVRSPNTAIAAGKTIGDSSASVSNGNGKIQVKAGFRQPGPDEAVDEEGIALSLLPVMPKCSPDGDEVKKMRALFPGVSLSALVRFLVARKGSVELASQMLTTHLKWRQTNFPLHPERSAGVMKALETGIFFPFGVAKDGTPVLVFRGAFYNPAQASPDDFALAFAWGIEESLRNTGQLQVTVLANCRHAEGATNASAELGFIKKLVGTLSDNFPERLKRTVLFPMPWYARALKSAASVFMDPRSMAKMIFSGYDKDDSDPEVFKWIDPDQVPAVIGGTSKLPIPNVAQQLRDSFKSSKVA